MAYANPKDRKRVSGWFKGVAAKTAIVCAVCLAVRVLLAQATGSGPLVQEEVDPDTGFKYQKPLAGYLDPKNKGKIQSRITEMRKLITSQPAPINDAATKAQLDPFYVQYLFPMMTTKEGLKTIADDRVRFLRDHVAAAKDPAAHSYLTNIALSSMSRIVQDPAYHPSARYNAMLLVSNLNDVEPNTIGTAQTLPEPMRTTLLFILQQYQKADRDEIKLAALLG